MTVKERKNGKFVIVHDGIALGVYGTEAEARAVPQAGEAVVRAVETALEALHDFRQVLDAGEPEERKAVVRAFLEGLRVDKEKRQAILRWFRLPRLDESLKVVEGRGFEPPTSALRTRRSPN